MSLLVKLLPHHLPSAVKKKILAELFVATADAFSCPHPVISQLSYAETLRAYAAFTRDQAESALNSGRDLAELKTQLYQNAYPLGASLRKCFWLNSIQDVIELEQTLYRAIGVEQRGNGAGSLVVSSCYYSQFYSASVCDLISALDDGLFSGLSAGHHLLFTHRLTQGSSYCFTKIVAMSS